MRNWVKSGKGWTFLTLFECNYSAPHEFSQNLDGEFTLRTVFENSWGGQSGFTACPPHGTAQIPQISKLI